MSRALLQHFEKSASKIYYPLFSPFQLRYLELLKLRFGESHLHFCEIMLKDVADSRRINSHIQVLGCSDNANVVRTRTGTPDVKD